MWTRRPTLLDEQDTVRDDWIVLRDGIEVGRTYWRINGRDGSRWFWASWGRRPQTGVSNDLESALESIRAAILASD